MGCVFIGLQGVRAQLDLRAKLEQLMLRRTKRLIAHQASLPACRLPACSRSPVLDLIEGLQCGFRPRVHPLCIPSRLPACLPICQPHKHAVFALPCTACPTPCTTDAQEAGLCRVLRAHAPAAARLQVGAPLPWRLCSYSGDGVLSDCSCAPASGCSRRRLDSSSSSH